jgi:hypothetical protein
VALQTAAAVPTFVFNPTPGLPSRKLTSAASSAEKAAPAAAAAATGHSAASQQLQAHPASAVAVETPPLNDVFAPPPPPVPMAVVGYGLLPGTSAALTTGLNAAQALAPAHYSQLYAPGSYRVNVHHQINKQMHAGCSGTGRRHGPRRCSLHSGAGAGAGAAHGRVCRVGLGHAPGSGAGTWFVRLIQLRLMYN